MTCRGWSSGRFCEVAEAGYFNRKPWFATSVVCALPRGWRASSEPPGPDCSVRISRFPRGRGSVTPMKLVIYPAVDPDRLASISEAAGPMCAVNAADEPAAIAEIGDADCFFGKITPPILAAARQLRWIQ